MIERQLTELKQGLEQLQSQTISDEIKAIRLPVLRKSFERYSRPF